MGPFRVTLCFICVSTEASKLVYDVHFYTRISKKKKKDFYISILFRVNIHINQLENNKEN
jgi:hypothetical protein